MGWEREAGVRLNPIMKKLQLCLAVGLAALVSPSVHAGGTNKLISASQRGDGFARVVRVGNKDVVEVLDMPRATARMICKSDGFRVNKVGPQSFQPVKTDVTHSWNMAASEGPSAASLGAVCRAGRAAATLPVTVSGDCKKVKPVFRVTGVDRHQTLKIPFAVDCRGYDNTQREAVVMLKHPQRNDNLVLPAGKLWYAESLGYERIHVLGDAPRSDSSTRKPMHMGAKNGMRGAAVAPVTMIGMHKKGWTISPKPVGFVEKNDAAGRTALHSFYHSGRRDYATAAGTGPVEELVAQGYKHLTVEGFIYPPKK